MSPSWRLEWKTVCAHQEGSKNGKKKIWISYQHATSKASFRSVSGGAFYNTRSTSMNNNNKKNLSIIAIMQSRNSPVNVIAQAIANEHCVG